MGVGRDGLAAQAVCGRRAAALRDTQFTPPRAWRSPTSSFLGAVPFFLPDPSSFTGSHEPRAVPAGEILVQVLHKLRTYYFHRYLLYFFLSLWFWSRMPNSKCLNVLFQKINKDLNIGSRFIFFFRKTKCPTQ